jgi:hypothetical protein
MLWEVMVVCSLSLSLISEISESIRPIHNTSLPLGRNTFGQASGKERNRGCSTKVG